MNSIRTNGQHIYRNELLDQVVQDVRRQIGDIVPEAVVREHARAALQQYELARISNFVPLLASRVVLDRIRSSTQEWTRRRLASAEETAQVLFVCIHNSGRSVMAEYFFNQMATERGLRAQARSAGTHPGTGVNPVVAAAMAEAGIDVAAHQPRCLTEELVRGADFIFSMGCSVDTNTCPSSLIKDLEDWHLDDPHGKPLDEVRVVRQEVRTRVASLLDRLAELLAAEGRSAQA